MPAAKSPPNLEFLDVGAPIAQTSETDQLFQDELKTFSAPDQDSDEEHERKIRRQFQVKQLEQFEGILKSRKDYASKIFKLVVGWLVGLGVVVLLAGWKVCGFSLEKSVLLALIGGTTLNVLGIFTIVTNFLFPKGGNTLFALNDVLGPMKPAAKPTSRRTTKNPPPAEVSPPNK